MNSGAYEPFRYSKQECNPFSDVMENRIGSEMETKHAIKKAL